MAKGEGRGALQLLASASQAPLSLFRGTPARLSGVKDDKVESEKETGAAHSHLENVALCCNFARQTRMLQSAAHGYWHR